MIPMQFSIEVVDDSLGMSSSSIIRSFRFYLEGSDRICPMPISCRVFFVDGWNRSHFSYRFSDYCTPHMEPFFTLCVLNEMVVSFSYCKDLEPVCLNA